MCVIGVCNLWDIVWVSFFWEFSNCLICLVILLSVLVSWLIVFDFFIGVFVFRLLLCICKMVFFKLDKWFLSGFINKNMVKFIIFSEIMIIMVISLNGY